MNLQTVKRTRRPVERAATAGVSLPGVWGKVTEYLSTRRFLIYISVLLMACVAGSGYQVRTRTIFACPADGYSADRYLAYCNGANYADYEHGAFAFDLEPSVQDAVKNADVLFLGNSRVQVAFSTAPTERWFSRNSARYYLLGFSYYENALFEGKLLDRIHPRARVYVINVNDFFVPTESVPVRAILHDPRASEEYRSKRFWQSVHEQICGTMLMLCGRRFAIFRSRDTGAYYTEGAVGPRVTPVSYEATANQAALKANVAAAVHFLSRVAEKSCVILTIVPYVGTDIQTARAIASGLGLKLVSPETLEGLQTYDGFHLDQPSAQRWSQAFFQAAGPELRSCLDSQDVADRRHP